MKAIKLLILLVIILMVFVSIPIIKIEDTINIILLAICIGILAGIYTNIVVNQYSYLTRRKNNKIGIGTEVYHKNYGKGTVTRQPHNKDYAVVTFKNLNGVITLSKSELELASDIEK